jgi:hypothetical protein
MLALSFVLPALTFAAAAAAAPVIIHLILRTKPRRVLFPAMRFVRQTRQANLSKLRLKHLLLLLMRMGVIVLLAMVMARAFIPGWLSVADRSVPAAAVVVVDNSGSMDYVHRGQPLLARGKRLAQQLIEDLPPGSRVAVLPTDGAPARLSFLSDASSQARQLAGVEQSCGSRPLGPAIARAVGALAEIEDMPRKEVFVVTDMTARAWRDLKPAGAEDVRYVVLDCGAGENANVALGELKLENSSVPAGAKLAVETVLKSGQVGGELDLRLEVGGRVVDSKPVSLAPDSTATLSLEFSPREAGVVHGRIAIAQKDPLELDNARYFTVHVGEPAEVLIVRDPATVGRGDETSFLMGHAIAPAGAGGSDVAWIRRRTITADHLAEGDLAGARIVLLADVAALTGKQWAVLERFVTAGGHLWVVVGSLVSPSSYNSPPAQRILPAAAGSLETLPSPMAWRADKAGEPMLAPFADAGNPPLSDVLVERRLKLTTLAGDARTVLRYADDKEAIVTRRCGLGSALLWNFSPARGYSNLASLPQFVVLAQRTARLLAVGAAEQTAYQWGQSVSVSVPSGMTGATTTVRRAGAKSDQPVPITRNQHVVSLTADQLGPWTVRFVEAARAVERGFSVNADFAESDLSPVDVAQLKTDFPADRLVIAKSPDDLAEHCRLVSQPLDIAVPLLLAMLALMIGESYFANRFYRRETSAQGPTP